jgi:cobalt-zinc-cadmium efflux system protein
MKKAVKIFLQSVPSGISLEQIEKKIMGVEKVVAVHDLHAWSLDGEHHILTLHAVVKKNTAYSKICKIKGQIKQIAQKMNISHATIEIELDGEECSYEKC